MSNRLLHINDRPGEHAPSYYAATANPAPDREPLRGDVLADVCVIGGGFTGLSAALHLAERGYSVALLEAHRIGWGASGRNGGQVGSGQRLEPDDLERVAGRDLANAAWRLGDEARETVKSRIAQHAIACGWRPGVLHAVHRARYNAHAQAHAARLNDEFGYGEIRYCPPEEVAQMVAAKGLLGGTLDMGAGHLHPLNFALGLAAAAKAAGARLFDRSEVLRITPGDPATIATAQGRVRARWVVFGCNGYLGGLERKTAARALPINNFIIATEPLGEAAARALIRDNVAVADSRFVVNYFRLSEDWRMLFGGGESYGDRFPRDIGGYVRGRMLRLFPQLAGARIDYAWGGTLAVTPSRLPYFGRVGPNMLSAAGFSGHGVALATGAGRWAAEAIAGQAEKFDIMARLPVPRFYGGDLLRRPALALAMQWFALRDRL